MLLLYPNDDCFRGLALVVSRFVRRAMSKATCIIITLTTDFLYK